MFVYLFDGLLEVATTLLIYLSPSGYQCTITILRTMWVELLQGYFA
jgi:hypothetical protein